MSITRKEINAIIKECIKDDLILVRPTKESAQLYGVNYDEMLRIKTRVKTELGITKGVKHLREVKSRKKKFSIERSLTEGNSRYDNLVRDIYENANLSELGRKFGLTRQRIHQYKKLIDELIEIEGEDYVRDFIYITLSK